MDGRRFDNLTRSSVASRRPLLLGLAASGLSTLLANRDAAAGNRNGCKTDAGCDGKDACIESKCCPSKRVFVECPVEKLCTDTSSGEQVCCAEHAKELCCSKEMTCGSYCCRRLPNGKKQKCKNGTCKPFLAATFVRVRRR
jgi:hypothetical protein